MKLGNLRVLVVGRSGYSLILYERNISPDRVRKRAHIVRFIEISFLIVYNFGIKQDHLWKA